LSQVVICKEKNKDKLVAIGADLIADSNNNVNK
jgi:hypothetical protein